MIGDRYDNPVTVVRMPHPLRLAAIAAAVWLPFGAAALIHSVPMATPDAFLAWGPAEVLDGVRSQVELLPISWMLAVVLIAGISELLLLAVALAITGLGIVSFRRAYRRQARAARGCCLACGHQLLPEQPRCPECDADRPGPPPPRSRRQAVRAVAVAVGSAVAGVLLSMALLSVAHLARMQWEAEWFIAQARAAEAAGTIAGPYRVPWTATTDIGLHDELVWTWSPAKGFTAHQG